VKSTYLSVSITIRRRIITISQIEFPKAFTILGNLALAGWIALDTLGFLQVNLAAGVTFFLVALIAVYGVLKFLGCLRPCYNCKKCTYGMGRLSALYFGRRGLKDYKFTYGLGVALFFFILLGPFPAAILLVSALQALTLLKAAVLICLSGASLLSARSWWKT